MEGIVRKYVGNDPLGRIEDEEVLEEVHNFLAAYNLDGSDIVWGVLARNGGLIILYTEMLVVVIHVEWKVEGVVLQGAVVRRDFE
jgi:hypothetical protein